MLTLVKKLLDGNEREVRKLQRHIDKINSLELQMEALSDPDLAAKTLEFRLRLEKGETLDDLLPEAFAVVREAARRTIGLRHYDVQLIGGIVLHQGRIAEMRTGEGKTLVATLPVYLNALEGRGVHVVTVNDYLAKRDREWMGPIYEFLGLSVGVIQHDLAAPDRHKAYRCDITFGTNNEMGFDYLRDNMVIYKEERVQRELNFAIVDEVDSILIDEARTPLIISGLGGQTTDEYQRFARVVRKLKKETHYTVDEKAHSVPLTDEGVGEVERALGIKNLYDNANMELTHHINAALKAKELYKRDVEYVIKDGEIIIVDEFTGRLMFGRRFSDGLHQAIEAKEGVKVRQEDQTLATITFQNFFRLYRKLAGMTGTAATEEKEFRDIYKMDVVVIPTHRPMIRADHSDLVYKTEQAKFEAAVEEIKQLHQLGRPVLVGTRSIEKSEELSFMLKRIGIPHNVLNAKHHEKEATIISQAGHKGAVTIATNMAGRGVDIVLGGNPPDPAEQKEVLQLGGLHILGTERHESRRIDNQLRGRSGRQGDPGSSRFYVALEDELMRLFGSDRISGLMDKLGVEDDIPIEHSWITKAIENAQQKVESHHYSIRKNVLEYDDVMNEQRRVIYAERLRVLEGEDLKPHIMDMLEHNVDELIRTHAPENVHAEDWDLEGLWHGIHEVFIPPQGSRMEDLGVLRRDELRETVLTWARRVYDDKEKRLTSHIMRQLERIVVLRMIDTKWIDHLYGMDMLREGIGLRAWGQKDPRIEYINEAFEMFEGLKARIQEDTVKYLFRVEVDTGAMEQREVARVTRTHRGEGGESGQTVRRDGRKVGRNEPCPCGSGKKYKRCCGAAA